VFKYYKYRLLESDIVFCYLAVRSRGGHKLTQPAQYDGVVLSNHPFKIWITENNNNESEVGTKTYDNITFHYDTQDQEVKTEIFDSIPTSHLKPILEQPSHSILDFLARPVQIGNGLITTSLASNTVVNTILLPQDWIQKPVVKQKVQGFRFF